VTHLGTFLGRPSKTKKPYKKPNPLLMPKLIFILLCSGLLLSTSACAQPLLPQLDTQELEWLGQQIYRNECNSQRACLTSWNAGEDFPSMGIGHFIWFRNGQVEPFAESFPGLLIFLQEHGIQVPNWLGDAEFFQPWPTRDAFLAAREGKELEELRSLLESTMALQTRYILQRFSVSMEKLMAALSPGQRQDLESKFQAILAQDRRLGMYALIDYVHFKGDGSNPAERYAGQGWGLLQVLDAMPPQSTNALQDFVDSASTVLQRRVALAPAQRNEARWLNGWQNRLNSYLPTQ
jgi:hypothetical protein